MGDWISVDEQMPEEDGECNVYYCGDVSCLWFSVKENCWIIYDRFGDIKLIDGEVTHWQPLPEPPQ